MNHVNLLAFFLRLVGTGLLLVFVRWVYGHTPQRRWLFALAALPLGLLALALLAPLLVAVGTAPPSLPAFIGRTSLLLVALALLAYFPKIYPHRPLIYLALAPAVLSLVLLAPQVAADARAWMPLAVFDGLIALAAAIDLFSLPRRRSLELGREVTRVASLGQPHEVRLLITNFGKRGVFIWLRDDVPHELHPRPDEFRLRLAGGSRAAFNYQLHATRRGAFALPMIHVRARSRWGLWQRLMDYEVGSVVHVYPDMKQLTEYALLARTNRLSLLGVRRTRRIGQDNEFERLRDFTLDDNYKHIDWRSTARRRKLTVKDFQTNQSQRLIFMLDCGRMMTNLSDGLSLLDYSLNAMLMLSYVALSHGDAVGLVCFSDEVHTYVPPSGGRRQMNRLLHASFDRFPRLVESRYDQAFLYLAAHCRKRSLVILISNLIDEVNANQVGQYLGTFSGRHLPLGVLLRDHRLFDAADELDPQGEALFRAAAAADILAWRNQVLADLEAKGVLALDVYPEGLTAPLINSYLEIKARHLL
ncbi:MAG TPA: DUF58 domain-containing protein [Pirellulales bacterium]|nr:DUF58 domain-containing protein [Pirellulales bacterium]